MGSTPYLYFVPYRADFRQALTELRVREFDQGRYNPVMFMPPGIIDEETSPGPGRKHNTIEEALSAAAEDGTRSILDIEAVGDEPGVGVARRLTEEELRDYFETTTPTRAQVLDNLPMHRIERGEAWCLPVYDANGLPVAVCFAGYSSD
jgi:hypothetical protein